MIAIKYELHVDSAVTQYEAWKGKRQSAQHLWWWYDPGSHCSQGHCQFQHQKEKGCIDDFPDEIVFVQIH